MPTGLQSLRSAIRALVESNNGRARFRERVVAARSEYFKMADAHEAFQRRRIEYAAGQGEPSGPRAEDWSLDGIPIDGKVRGCWFPPGLRAVDAPPDTCNFPEYLNAFTPTLALKYALLAAIHDADPETIEMIDPWRRLERETTIEAEWFAGLVRWARTLGVDADDDDAGKRLGAWVADVRDDLNVSPTARLLGALADADERGRALAELPRELRMNLAASVQPATAGDAKPEAAGNGAGNNGGEAGAKGAGKRLRRKRVESFLSDLEWWRYVVRDQVDDINCWRLRPTDDLLDNYFSPNRERFAEIVDALPILTKRLVEVIVALYPRLDPAPVLALHDAIRSWHARKDADGIPSRDALFATLDRALIVVSAVEADLVSRRCGNPWLDRNGGDAKPEAAGKRLRHSSDFRSVQWHGVDYTFTATQAAIVKQLWEAYENGTPDVGGDTLLVNAESDTRRMADVFKKHPAWGSMIVEGSTKGTYRLAPDPA